MLHIHVGCKLRVGGWQSQGTALRAVGIRVLGIRVVRVQQVTLMRAVGIRVLGFKVARVQQVTLKGRGDQGVRVQGDEGPTGRPDETIPKTLTIPLYSPSHMPTRPQHHSPCPIPCVDATRTGSSIPSRREGSRDERDLAEPLSVFTAHARCLCSASPFP